MTSVLTKSSFFWTPVVYILSDKRIQENINIFSKTKVLKKAMSSKLKLLSIEKKCRVVDPIFLN